MKNKNNLIIICLIWTLIFGGLILSSEYTLRRGVEVLIKTIPVDPRDWLRGDYVVLDYSFSRLPNTTGKKIGDHVYVKLIYNSKTKDVLDKDSYVIRDKIVKKNSLKDKDYRLSDIFIKGVVKHINAEGELVVDYGIGTYFVPEGQGKEIEHNLGLIKTKVVIDRKGKALIKALVLNGKDITFE